MVEDAIEERCCPLHLFMLNLLRGKTPGGRKNSLNSVVGTENYRGQSLLLEHQQRRKNLLHMILFPN